MLYIVIGKIFQYRNNPFLFEGRKSEIMDKQHNIRNSGIESIKILAIILIIIGHTVQTLTSPNIYVPYQDYVLDVSIATTDIQHFILSLSRYFGAFGNAVFFVCSAWFLLDSQKVDGRKIFVTLFNVWGISVIIFIIVSVLYNGNIDIKMTIQEFFPTTFSNNWYITSYLLFYSIHPILNNVIYGVSKKSLLRVSLTMSMLFIWSHLAGECFFDPSVLILWGTIYFSMGYMKLYLKGMASDKKSNLSVLLIGLFGNFGSILLINDLGLKIGFFEDRLLCYAKNCNPFSIMTAIALLNLTKESKWKNKWINHISHLSLFIYIIHENILLRTYFRPFLINYIYENFGYRYILCSVFLLSMIIFFSSVVAGFFYEKTIQKIVLSVSEKLYLYWRRIYIKLEESILRGG